MADTDTITGAPSLDGWVLVPREPTPAMRDAYHEADERYEEGGGWKPDMHWTAMLAAAPPPEALAQALAVAREEGRVAGLEEAAKVADDWLRVWGERQPQHVSAQSWANGAVRDIAEVIREAIPTPAQTDTAPGGRADG